MKCKSMNKIDLKLNKIDLKLNDYDIVYRQEPRVHNDLRAHAAFERNKKLK